MNLVHHGDYGDVIYSLAAAKALGPARVHLRPALNTRQVMSPAVAAALLPLLEAQPYVTSATTDAPPEGAVALDKFRGTFRAARNLADQQLEALGLALTWRDAPWVEARPASDVPPVLVHRSPRYHNDRFPWPAVLERYRGRMAFVGARVERDAFCDRWSAPASDLPHLPTADFLELAGLIAGARLFVGNGSAPYALAEALRRPAVHELCLYTPTTIFRRPGLLVGFDESAAARLPEV